MFRALGLCPWQATHRRLVWTVTSRGRSHRCKVKNYREYVDLLYTWHRGGHNGCHLLCSSMWFSSNRGIEVVSSGLILGELKPRRQPEAKGGSLLSWLSCWWYEWFIIYKNSHRISSNGSADLDTPYFRVQHPKGETTMTKPIVR